MANLLAMSFDGELAPSFTLRCLEAGRTLPDRWGLGYYPKGCCVARPEAGLVANRLAVRRRSPGYSSPPGVRRRE